MTGEGKGVNNAYATPIIIAWWFIMISDEITIKRSSIVIGADNQITYGKITWWMNDVC